MEPTGAQQINVGIINYVSEPLDLIWLNQYSEKQDKKIRYAKTAA